MRNNWSILLFLSWLALAASSKTFSNAGAQQPAAVEDDWQTPKPFRPDLQSKISTHSDMWDVSLVGWHRCPEALSQQCFTFQVENRLTHKTSAMQLANQTAQIDALAIVGRSHAAILGRPLPNLSSVTILDLTSGREIDRIVCTRPSLSPDNRLLAYLKFAPVHPGYDWSPSAEYLVYDMTKSPEENRTPPNRLAPLEPYDVGWPLYPEDAKDVPGDNMFYGHDVPTHWMISPFAWLTSRNGLAFVDRWHETATLVVAYLGGGAQQPNLSVLPLDATALFNLNGCRDKMPGPDFQALLKDPVTMVNVTQMYLTRDDPGVLHLRLLPHACLRTNAVDVDLDAPRQ